MYIDYFDRQEKSTNKKEIIFEECGYQTVL